MQRKPIGAMGGEFFQKARAAVLLRFRGKRLPNLEELRSLTAARI